VRVCVCVRACVCVCVCVCERALVHAGMNTEDVEEGGVCVRECVCVYKMYTSV